MKRNIYLLSLMLLLVQSCSWDSALYDEFVSGEVVTPCPPRIFELDGKLVTYEITDDGIVPVECDKFGKKITDSSANDATDAIEMDNGGHYLRISESVRWKLYSWKDVESYLKDSPEMSYILAAETGSCQDEASGCYKKCEKGDCPEFEKSFLYGICPKQSNSCEMQMNNDNNRIEFYCRPKTKSCQKDEHLYGDECEKDSVTQCGSHDNDCAKLAGWNGGICNSGLCDARECQDNYHWVSDAVTNPGTESLVIGRCEADTHECCGEECTPCADTAKCVLGVCTDVCEKGTHIYGETCEEDSEVNCGSHDNNCSKLAGWEDGKCDENVMCSASQCQLNYHLVSETSEPGRCEADTHECCGEECVTCAVTAKCEYGTCSDVCESGTHIFGDNCEEDSVENCGTHGNNCHNIAGWNDGECTEGRCTPTSCKVGYHLKNSLCVGDDSNNCGEENHECLSGQVCVNGQCQSNCGDRLVLCISQDVSSAQCIDPLTSIEYCGARSDCTGYVKCTNGKICTDGVCVQQTCIDETKTLCTVKTSTGLVYTCIDVHGKDADHCGGCNYSCSTHPLSNATSSSCSNGKCQYTCKSGFSNCGTSEAPECISSANMKTDPNHCGSCTKKCASNEYCSNGACIKSSCASSNQCLDISSSTCVNTNEKCGIQCVNCKTANHASNGTCSNGKCTITNCEVGYHLSNGSCVLNSDTSCAATNSSSVQNCKTYNNATSGVCTNGTCTATSCKEGYHLNQGTCEADSATKCGSGKVNCTTLPGWNGGTCTKGVCVANSCKKDYCLNKNTYTCVDGTSNANTCGSQKDCTKCGGNQSCVNAVCTTTSCNATTCFYQGTTCSNTNTHCGKNCINCTTAGNASAGSCNSKGECVIESCAKGYHKTSSGTCAENTDTACGSPKTANVVNCNTSGNAASGVCTVSGTCLILSCKPGYHLSGKTCVQDSVDACGSAATKCSSLAGWKGGNCTSGKCVASSCTADYCLLSGTCVKGKQNAYSCGINSAACKACSATQYCANGTCKDIPANP